MTHHCHTMFTGNQTRNLTPHLSGLSLCLTSQFCRRGLCFALLPHWLARRGAPRCFAALSSHNSPRRCLRASWTTPNSAATDWTDPSWSFWSVAWWWRPRSPTPAWRPRSPLLAQPAACTWSLPGVCVGARADGRECRGPRAGRRRWGGSGRSRGS